MEIPSAAPDLLALHRRILNGDRQARDQLVEVVLPGLRRRIAAAFRKTEERLRWDGITQALAEYWTCPARFDPPCWRSLEDFLYVLAYRRVLDFCRTDDRRKQRDKNFFEKNRAAHAAFAPSAEITYIEDTEDRASMVLDLVPDPADREVLRLWAAGERGVRPYAEALGISHLPPDEQRKQVKLAKARVRRCAQKIARKLGLYPPPSDRAYSIRDGGGQLRKRFLKPVWWIGIAGVGNGRSG